MKVLRSPPKIVANVSLTRSSTNAPESEFFLVERLDDELEIDEGPGERHFRDPGICLVHIPVILRPPSKRSRGEESPTHRGGVGGGGVGGPPLGGERR